MTAAFAVVNAPSVWALPRAWRERRTAGSGDTDLWLWLLSAVVSVAVGLRFFGHYYLQLLPPLVLITTGVLMRSSGRAVKRTTALAAGIAVVASGLAFLVRPFNEKAQYKPVSQYLKERAGRNDRILVWGHVPEIYWASGRRPATRFLTSGFLSGWEPGRPGNRPRPRETIVAAVGEELVAVGRRRGERRIDDPEIVELGHEVVRVVLIEWSEPTADPAKDLDEDAAEAEGHRRAELG